MAKLEAMLEQRGIATAREMSEAIARCQLHGGDLTTSLLQFVSADEALLSAALSECYGLAAAAVGPLPAADDGALRSLPRDVAERYCCFPLSASPGRLVLAVAHPLEPALKEELGATLGVVIEERVALEVRIRQALSRHYGVPLSARNQRGIARLEGEVEAGSHETPLGLWSEAQLSTLPRPPSELPPSSPRPPSVRPRSRNNDGARFGTSSAPPSPNNKTSRRREPMTLARAREELGRAGSRNEVLDVFFGFACQFFEYSALFAVHNALAEGLDAWGKGADRDAVLGIGVPLDLPSSLSEVAESCKVRLTRLGKEGIDRTLAVDLQRQFNARVLLLPVSLRGRCAMLLYADNGEADVVEREIADLIALAADVANALGRIILQRKKDASRSRSVEPPDGSPAPRRSQPAASAPDAALRAVADARGAPASEVSGEARAGARRSTPVPAPYNKDGVQTQPVVSIGPDTSHVTRARASSPPLGRASAEPASGDDPVFLLARPQPKASASERARAGVTSPSSGTTAQPSRVQVSRVQKPQVSITVPARLVASRPRLPSVIVDPESADPEASERATRAAAITRAPTQMRTTSSVRRPFVPPAADAPRRNADAALDPRLAPTSPPAARATEARSAARPADVSNAARAADMPSSARPADAQVASRPANAPASAPDQEPAALRSAGSGLMPPAVAEVDPDSLEDIGGALPPSSDVWPPPIMDHSPPPRQPPLTALVPIIIADSPKNRRGMINARTAATARPGTRRGAPSSPPGASRGGTSPTVPSPSRARAPETSVREASPAAVSVRTVPSALGASVSEPSTRDAHADAHSDNRPAEAARGAHAHDDARPADAARRVDPAAHAHTDGRLAADAHSGGARPADDAHGADAHDVRAADAAHADGARAADDAHSDGAAPPNGAARAIPRAHPATTEPSVGMHLGVASVSSARIDTSVNTHATAGATASNEASAVQAQPAGIEPAPAAPAPAPASPTRAEVTPARAASPARAEASQTRAVASQTRAVLTPARAAASPTRAEVTPARAEASQTREASVTASAPTASSPTASSPTASSPTASPPTVAAPTASSPTISSPTASSPTASSPTASSSTASSPTAPSPTASSPTISLPTASSPTASSPTASSPTVSAPRPAGTTGTRPALVPVDSSRGGRPAAGNVESSPARFGSEPQQHRGPAAPEHAAAASASAASSPTPSAAAASSPTASSQSAPSGARSAPGAAASSPATTLPVPSAASGERRSWPPSAPIHSGPRVAERAGHALSSPPRYGAGRAAETAAPVASREVTASLAVSGVASVTPAASTAATAPHTLRDATPASASSAAVSRSETSTSATPTDPSSTRPSAPPSAPWRPSTLGSERAAAPPSAPTQRAIAPSSMPKPGAIAASRPGSIAPSAPGAAAPSRPAPASASAPSSVAGAASGPLSADAAAGERPAIFPPPPPADAEIEELVDSVCQGDPRAVQDLARIGAPSLPQVMARFPGPVISERPSSRASECGPLLRALAAIGSPAMPSITQRSEDGDARVRRWATLLLGEMPSLEACRAVVQRLADDEPRVHQAALDAARLLLAGPAAETFRDTLFDVAEADDAPLTLRLRTIEHVAKLKDSASVPRLVAFLAADVEPIVHKALWALGVVTRHDFGRDARAWTEFWNQNQGRPRIEWLIDALDPSYPRSNKAAADELREEAGELFGYAEEQSPEERRQVQDRFRTWWQSGATRRRSSAPREP